MLHGGEENELFPIGSVQVFAKPPFEPEIEGERDRQGAERREEKQNVRQNESAQNIVFHDHALF